MTPKRRIKFVIRRVCLVCQESFTIANGRQIYCGAERRKIGCSWIMRKKQQYESFKKWLNKNRKKYNNYQNKYYHDNKE